MDRPPIEEWEKRIDPTPGGRGWYAPLLGSEAEALFAHVHTLETALAKWARNTSHLMDEDCEASLRALAAAVPEPDTPKREGD